MRSFLGLGLALSASALHLPGSQPTDYATGDKVELKVNKLWSAKTQLTYDYYSLPVCKPDIPIEDHENIGQILVGDRITSSDYQIFVGKDSRCNVLCSQTYTEEDISLFKERIDDEYTVNWYLDGLPAAVRMVEEDNPDRVHLERGFPLGFAATVPSSKGDSAGTRRHFLFNHVQFVIGYHQEEVNDGTSAAIAGALDPALALSSGLEKAPTTAFRIVGFEVEPYTVKHKKMDDTKDWKESGNLGTCSATRPVTREDEPQAVDAVGEEVVFTYDVIWEPSPVRWAERWDVYLRTGADDDIHWFSIINSLLIVMFLTGLIALILVRNLYRDFARYEGTAMTASTSIDAEEAAEETGWKLVHGDVFRPPAGFFGPMFLSVFVGSGVQILAMSVFLLVFAVLGFLSPANQGALLTAFIVLYMFMGSFAGYFSARLYKMFRGKAWKRNTLLTAFAFPGTIFGIAFVLNLFVWAKHSSMAVPFTTVLVLFALYFGIAVPLTFLGSYFGFKKDEIKHPVRVTNIPRQVPTQPWYLHPVPAVLVGGILPFGSVFIELFFIMSSIWLAQMYYVFGFLFLVLAILVVTCAEISIVMTYFQLCSEDYNWWWRSFLTSGSSALYLFLYSIVYFVTRLEITKPVSSLLYFGYMAMASWAFFLLTGAIGFVSTLVFVSKIYGAIKVD